MGISKGGARLLLAEAAMRPFSGRVMQLGRQHLFFPESDLVQLAAMHKVTLHPKFVEKNRRNPLLGPGHIDDGSFFALLGFEQVESCDISNDEQPTHVFDLNRPLPEHLVGQYDAIYDGGTIEHVFHIPQALANIHAMLKPGGRIIHTSPSSNHVDHGFYMFSPTLFTDYYAANRYDICDALVFEYTKNHNVEPWMIYRYEPKCLDAMSFGGFDTGKLLGVFLVAQKRVDSDCNVIPQQGSFLRQWQDAELTVVRDRQYAGFSLNHLRQQQAAFPTRRSHLIMRIKRKIARVVLKFLQQNQLLLATRPIDALKIAEY